MEVEGEGGTTRPNAGEGEGAEQTTEAGATTKHTQQDLEFELISSIECLRQLGIILENSKPENEAYFFQKINKLVEHFQRVHDMQNAVDETVPVALIQDYLDKGLNPELYTKKRLEVAEALHQQNKGRVDSLKLLRDNVQRFVHFSFPHRCRKIARRWRSTTALVPCESELCFAACILIALGVLLGAARSNGGLDLQRRSHSTQRTGTAPTQRRQGQMAQRHLREPRRDSAAAEGIRTRHVQATCRSVYFSHTHILLTQVKRLRRAESFGG
eukprot:1233697-Rhodomonas_salina.1